MTLHSYEQARDRLVEKLNHLATLVMIMTEHPHRPEALQTYIPPMAQDADLLYADVKAALGLTKDQP